MKHVFLLILLGFFALSTRSQIKTDQELIVQQCIDLPELQNHFPQDANGNYLAVYIMQYPMSFEEGLSIEKFEKGPVFMTREEINDNHVNSYFLFKKIEISGDNGWAEFSFYYDYNMDEQHVMHVSLDLKRVKNQWEIINSEIQKY